MAEGKKTRPRSVRQSVTIPEPLAGAIRRAAQQRHWTMSQAVVAFADRGIRAEAEAKRALHEAHERFVSASDDAGQASAGRDLIRVIFGDDAIAEDTVL